MKRCFYDRRTGSFVYDLYRGKRDTIEVAVLSGGEVRVRAPHQMTEAAIRRFLKEKAPWILKQTEKIRESKKTLARKRFEDGSVFYYLGEPLRLAPGKAAGESVWRADGALWIDQRILTAQKRREKLEKWYRERAKENIESRVRRFAGQVGKIPNNVKIKTQRRRWGSCSSLGNLNFNWKLIMLPQEMIDYVVVHELCHLKEMNHSRDFWRQVEAVLPDYQKRREWLRNNAWKVEWEQI